MDACMWKLIVQPALVPYTPNPLTFKAKYTEPNPKNPLSHSLYKCRSSVFVFHLSPFVQLIIINIAIIVVLVHLPPRCPLPFAWMYRMASAWRPALWSAVSFRSSSASLRKRCSHFRMAFNDDVYTHNTLLLCVYHSIQRSISAIYSRLYSTSSRLCLCILSLASC